MVANTMLTCVNAEIRTTVVKKLTLIALASLSTTYTAQAKNEDVIVDLTKNVTIKQTLEENKKVTFKLKYMNPSEIDKYTILESKTRANRDALPSISNVQGTKLQPKGDGQNIKVNDPTCDMLGISYEAFETANNAANYNTPELKTKALLYQLETFRINQNLLIDDTTRDIETAITDIENNLTNKELNEERKRELTTRLRNAKQALQAHKISLRADAESCLEEAKEEAALRTPIKEWSYDLSTSYKYTFTVKKDEKVFSEYHYEPEVKNWYVHAGFTFIQNQDEKYYSDQNDDGTYSIKEQHNQGNISYAATALFTYPMYGTGGDIEFGVSAGLGVAEKSILVVVGPSLIFAENIIVNLGYTITEFDELKGVYKKGDNIGSEALDSSTLTEEQYKGAFAVTIGYKF